MRRQRKQAGFTLIELMVSLTLFSFAIAGVLAIAVSMAQGFREQRQVVQTESTARSALEYIADAIRMSSPAVTDPEVQLSTSAPAAGRPHLVVGEIEDTQSPNSPLGFCETGAIRVYDNTNAPDRLELVFASGGTVTSVANPGWAAGTVALPLTDASNLAVDDYVLVTNGTKGHVVRITNLVGNTATVTAPLCTLNDTTSYGRGELVLRVMRARFYVGTFDSITPVLLMDPDGDGPAPEEPLADYVEDFQVAVGVDENNDGNLDDGSGVPPSEWGFSAGGPVSFTTQASATPGVRNLRALRITMVARAKSSLPGTAPNFQRPAVENHPQATTMDTFRRRILTSTVDVRNLKGSP